VELNEQIKKTLEKYLESSNIEEDITNKLKKEHLFIPEVSTSLKYKEAKKAFRKAYISKLLQIHFGNISLVAEILCVDRRTIHRIISELKINPTEHRKELHKLDYYTSMEIEDTIIKTLDKYKDTSNQGRLESIYQHTHELSRDLAREMPIQFVTLKEADSYFEKIYFEKILKENNGNITKAAKWMGLRYETLWRKVNQKNHLRIQAAD